MVLSAATRHAQDEEARAEVDVLNARLEKTSQLTKKIQASLSRLEASGKSVQDAIGPIYGNTQKLQVIGHNIDGILAAIEKVRQPTDTKNHEEEIMRQGPDRAGLSAFMASLRRINAALSDLQTSNLKSNQQAIADLSRLLRGGGQQLESAFRTMLEEDANPIEPLHYTTKDISFPRLAQDKSTKLLTINSFLASGPRGQNSLEIPTIQTYIKIRGNYLTSSLTTLNFAAINTAKKKNQDAIYRQGTNAIGMYATAMQGLFLAEYDSICTVFARQDCADVFSQTCRGAMIDLTRALRELDVHIRGNLTTDCFLAYEITEVIANVSSQINDRTGQLRPSFVEALKPIRDTGKSSLSGLLYDIQGRVNALQSLSQDGVACPVTAEIMTRLQTMVDFIRPVSSIMISLGDGNWKSKDAGPNTTDTIPSLKSFDVGADGQQLFANYCTDTFRLLLTALENKSTVLLKGRMVQGAFLLNNIAVMERMVRTSPLQSHLLLPIAVFEEKRKKARDLYLREWDDVSKILLDQIFTNRAGTRPPSGSANQTDSSAIIKQMNSKEKDALKEKFKSFNVTFDDLLAKHRALSLEREVREMLVRAVQSTIEPLYARFFDRYHEIDKGRGKYIKYDKSSISSSLMGLM